MVRPGIDVLLKRRRALLRGKRVGLVTNPTGVTAALVPTVDALRAAGVPLTALFGPEHGIRGDVQDGLPVAGSTDAVTGLPVYSLYGELRKPTAAMLKDVDLLLFDIQDIGCRYYTYLNTLAHVMEAAAEHDLPLVVLDRPNPLTGKVVEGPVLEPGVESFVGRFPVPVRYGLTIGEMARYINAEHRIGCRLKVVPMDGWRRGMWFDRTRLPWVPTSPNVPTFETTIVYPGTCLIEGTNLSEGRGTARPFELIGAPWLDAGTLAAEMNRRAHAGVRFRPASFTPTFSKHADVLCHGVQVHVTDRNALRSFDMGVSLVDACLRASPHSELLPSSWEGREPHLTLLSGVPRLGEMLRQGAPLADLLQLWRAPASDHARALRDFRRRARKYRLY